MSRWVQLLTVSEDGTATYLAWALCEHQHEGLGSLLREMLGEPSQAFMTHDGKGNLLTVSDIPGDPA